MNRMKKSIIVTYPDFKALPNAIKQLLLTSESFFFEDLRTMSTSCRTAGPAFVTFTVAKTQSEPEPKLSPPPPLHPWAKN